MLRTLARREQRKSTKSKLEGMAALRGFHDGQRALWIRWRLRAESRTLTRGALVGLQRRQKLGGLTRWSARAAQLQRARDAWMLMRQPRLAIRMRVWCVHVCEERVRISRAEIAMHAMVRGLVRRAFLSWFHSLLHWLRMGRIAAAPESQGRYPRRRYPEIAPEVHERTALRHLQRRGLEWGFDRWAHLAGAWRRMRARSALEHWRAGAQGDALALWSRATSAKRRAVRLVRRVRHSATWRAMVHWRARGVAMMACSRLMRRAHHSATRGALVRWLHATAEKQRVRRVHARERLGLSPKARLHGRRRALGLAFEEWQHVHGQGQVLVHMGSRRYPEISPEVHMGSRALRALIHRKRARAWRTWEQHVRRRRDEVAVFALIGRGEL